MFPDIPRVISLAVNGRAIPQIIKKFLSANQNCLTKLQFENKCSKFSLVSIQKVHNSVSLSPHLYSNELTGNIICNSLN
jgi:hypothetical protein